MIRYEWTIARLDIVTIGDNTIGLFIGLYAIGIDVEGKAFGGVSQDWLADKSEFPVWPPTKGLIVSHIKRHMREVTNQREIDDARERQGIDPTVIIPEPITRLQRTKFRVNEPVTVYKPDSTLTINEKLELEPP